MNELETAARSIVNYRYGSLYFLNRLRTGQMERMRSPPTLRKVIENSVLTDLKLAASPAFYKPFRGGIHEPGRIYLQTGEYAKYPYFYPQNLKTAVVDAQERVYDYAKRREEVWEKIPLGKRFFSLLQTPGSLPYSVAATTAAPFFVENFLNDFIRLMNYLQRDDISKVPLITLIGLNCTLTIVSFLTGCTTGSSMVEIINMQRRMKHELDQIMNRFDEFYQPESEFRRDQFKETDIGGAEHCRRNIIMQYRELLAHLEQETKRVEEYLAFLEEVINYSRSKYDDRFDERLKRLVDEERITNILDSLDGQPLEKYEVWGRSRERKHILRFVTGKREEFENLKKDEPTAGEFGRYLENVCTRD